MTALQIRNLPDDVHRTLKSRAAQRGQSLSDYAAQILRDEAEKPTLDEWWERVKSREPVEGVTTEDIVAIIRGDRESH